MCKKNNLQYIKEKLWLEIKETIDKLTWFEYLRIKNKINADTKQHKKTINTTIRR